MVSLDALRRNAERIDEAKWVDAETAFGTIRVNVSGFNPTYRSALHRYRTEAARLANARARPGTMPVRPDTLDPVTDSICVIRAICDVCLHGVDGITHTEGGDDVLSLQEFKDFLIKGDAAADPLRGAVLEAVASVTLASEQEAVIATGN